MIRNTGAASESAMLCESVLRRLIHRFNCLLNTRFCFRSQVPHVCMHLQLIHLLRFFKWSGNTNETPVNYYELLYLTVQCAQPAASTTSALRFTSAERSIRLHFNLPISTRALASVRCFTETPGSVGVDVALQFQLLC